MATLAPARAKAVKRITIIIGFWLVFTVFCGLAGLLARGTYFRPSVPEWNVMLNEVLRNGELLIVSTVLAADALGRLFRCFFLNHQCGGAPPRAWWAFSGLIVSFVCFFVTALYYATSMALQGVQTTEISTLIQDSLWAFGVTVAGALAIVIATMETE